MGQFTIYKPRSVHAVSRHVLKPKIFFKNKKFNDLTLNMKFISLARREFLYISSRASHSRKYQKSYPTREMNSIINVKTFNILYLIFCNQG